MLRTIRQQLQDEKHNSMFAFQFEREGIFEIIRDKEGSAVTDNHLKSVWRYVLKTAGRCKFISGFIICKYLYPVGDIVIEDYHEFTGGSERGSVHGSLLGEIIGYNIKNAVIKYIDNVAFNNDPDSEYNKEFNS